MPVQMLVQVQVVMSGMTGEVMIFFFFRCNKKRLNEMKGSANRARSWWMNQFILNSTIQIYK